MKGITGWDSLIALASAQLLGEEVVNETHVSEIIQARAVHGVRSLHGTLEGKRVRRM